jgi:hypothetical protein
MKLLPTLEFVATVLHEGLEKLEPNHQVWLSEEPVGTNDEGPVLLVWPAMFELLTECTGGLCWPDENLGCGMRSQS